MHPKWRSLSQALFEGRIRWISLLYIAHRPVLLSHSIGLRSVACLRRHSIYPHDWKNQFQEYCPRAHKSGYFQESMNSQTTSSLDSNKLWYRLLLLSTNTELMTTLVTHNREENWNINMSLLRSWLSSTLAVNTKTLQMTNSNHQFILGERFLLDVLRSNVSVSQLKILHVRSKILNQLLYYYCCCTWIILKDTTFSTEAEGISSSNLFYDRSLAYAWNQLSFSFSRQNKNIFQRPRGSDSSKLWRLLKYHSWCTRTARSFAFSWFQYLKRTHQILINT